MESSSTARPRLFSLADQWFDRTQAALLGELPCRRGCCRCCIGPFPITVLDRAELRRGLLALEEPERRDIEATARNQCLAMEASFSRLAESPFVDDWTDAEADSLVERFAHFPCPALASDGHCRIYAFRPVTCRMTGIPVERTGLIEGACDVQTAVPVIKPPSSARREEQGLARAEAAEIESFRRGGSIKGEELLLPYGFLQS